VSVVQELETKPALDLKLSGSQQQSQASYHELSRTRLQSPRAAKTLLSAILLFLLLLQRAPLHKLLDVLL